MNLTRVPIPYKTSVYIYKGHATFEIPQIERVEIRDSVIPKTKKTVSRRHDIGVMTSIVGEHTSSFQGELLFHYTDGKVIINKLTGKGIDWKMLLLGGVIGYATRTIQE